ncbi:MULTISPECIES: TRAP transporter small permease [unclassified Caballeronia]|jgi:TRAP-type C4-dicarboxylate transport system permease small subunit|uniref:TRAP transporter small permease n=1 Tax=unclassified Caballeronia TaxID=2646786 RepID=UPI001FD0060C|nr:MULTISPECIES: TRAP transporter small permease [unclassified Caballeronia]MDR5774424.1 TRAP transporter small permease [Caballeronia sp. LZ002]MDR5849859.1 TRAP transporter small permease [Caballeronia sp. LZ003]
MTPLSPEVPEETRMEKLARGLMFIDDMVLKLNLFVSSCLLLAAVIVAGLGVVFRFVLHDSLSWSDEAAAYLFVWLTCLGAAAGVKLRAHPEVRVLADRVPAAIAPLLKDFTDCAILALGAVFVAYGSDMLALMGTETAASIPISMVYPYLSIPVCGALLVFHSLVRIVVSHLAPQTQTNAALIEGVSDHL